MKKLLLLCAILASTLGAPNGFYYQESSSKSSSSSYKNNQLQHQTADESYFSEHGDLKGKAKPKINTYNQHIEYQNPNKQEAHGTSFGLENQNGFRHNDNANRYAQERVLESDGVLRTVSGNRNNYKYSATYGVAGGEVVPLTGGSYDTQSDLLSITQRIQNELSKQLANAITQLRSYDSYGSSSTYTEANVRQLEQELKANLTRQIQAELQKQYGTEQRRGLHSYSVHTGQEASQANYNTEELDDLTQQVENNLMQQLRNQYQSTQSSSSNDQYSSSQSSHQTGQNVYNGQSPRSHTTMYRPYREPFPLTPEVRPSIPLTDVVSQVQTDVDRTLNTALTQIEQQYLRDDVTYQGDAPNYDYILDNLKHELKRNLTRTLDNLLREYYGAQEEHHDYYYSSNKVESGSRTANYKIDDLNSLKQQVENNLINKIISNINQQKSTYETRSSRRSYSSHSSNGYTNTYQRGAPDKVFTSHVVFTPSQRPHTENSYGTPDHQSNIRPAYRPNYPVTSSDRPIRYGIAQPSPHGSNYDTTNNYQTDSQTQDSQRLEQLEYDYNPTSQQRPTGRRPTYPQSSHTGSNYPSNHGTNYPSGSTSRYPLNYQSSQQGSESSYQYAAGQRQSGIEYTAGSTRPQTNYHNDLTNIINEVQSDLSRQINTALQKQRQTATSYTSSSVSNDQVLADLSEEMKRNLTRKVEEALNEHYRRTGVRSGYSYTVSTGGRINPGSYSRDQITSMTNQLQEDFLRQLRESLQSNQRTGSSSTYEPIATHGSYGHGSNAYNSYSSSGSYSKGYSSGTTGQGECCMQGDDSTTIAEDLNQHREVPHRGDLHNNGKDIQKVEDIKKTTQQKHENFNNAPNQKAENHNVAPEVTAEESAETSTPGLARNKPSNRPKIINPIKPQQQLPVNAPQETSTTKATKINQDLIDFEKHQSEDQETENLHSTSQHHLDQSHFAHYDQAALDNVDHQTTDNCDQQTSDGFDQQTTYNLNQHALENFDQHALENFDQHTMDNFNQENVGSFDQQHSQITQQTIKHFDEETERDTTGKITQQTIHNQKPVDKNSQLHISNSNFRTNIGDNSRNQQNLYQSSYHKPSRISQTPYVSQQTENLSQNNENLRQQTEDLSQHTEDMSQHTEDLSQHTEDFSQQTEDLSQHTEDLIQQTEDLSQHTENNNQRPDTFNARRDFPRRYSGYNPNIVTQNIHTSQQNQQISQHTENLSQQTEDLSQHTEDLTQQTEDLSQHTENNNQRPDTFNTRRDFPRRYSGYNPNIDIVTQNIHTSQQNQQMSQQTEDMNQHFESMNQNNGVSHTHHNSQNSYHAFSSQSSRSHSSSAQNRQISYGSIHQIPIEAVSNLEQQHIDKQYASVVQDVSHQVAPIESSEISTEQKLEEANVIEISTTAAPGFWKKLGGKITDTYHKAKDKITSIG